MKDQKYFLVHEAPEMTSEQLIMNRDWHDILMSCGETNLGLEQFMFQPPPLHEARMRHARESHTHAGHEDGRPKCAVPDALWLLLPR